ncbi:hypothetical protein T08_8886 [Trichinella sp. T8]|nr:hypothetical protein T08_8886 [Trichinella sp. T8]
MPNSYVMHDQWMEYQNPNTNGVRDGRGPFPMLNLPEILGGDVEESSSATSNSILRHIQTDRAAVLAAGYLLTERSFHTADSCQAVIRCTARCPLQCGTAFLAVTRFSVSKSDNQVLIYGVLCCLVVAPGESATWYEWIVTPLLLLCCQVLKARLPLPAAPCYIYFGRLWLLKRRKICQTVGHDLTFDDILDRCGCVAPPCT